MASNSGKRVSSSLFLVWPSEKMKAEPWVPSPHILNVGVLSEFQPPKFTYLIFILILNAFNCNRLLFFQKLSLSS